MYNILVMYIILYIEEDYVFFFFQEKIEETVWEKGWENIQ
jgi:hypothetical protein